MAEWYEGTRGWKGGNSFPGFLENIFKEALAAYDLADRKALLASGEKTPTVTIALAKRLAAGPAGGTAADAVGRCRAGWPRADVPRARRPAARVDDALTETALEHPIGGTFAYLVQGLNSTNKVELFKVVEALKKDAGKPKPDDAAAYRAALLAAGRLGEADRWKVVELLRHLEQRQAVRRRRRRLEEGTRFLVEVVRPGVPEGAAAAERHRRQARWSRSTNMTNC